MKSLEEAWGPFGSLNRRMGKANAQAAARALALVVLEEAADVEQYTCNVACDHGEECRTARRAALRAKIEALGNESSGNLEWSRHGQSSGGGRKGYDRLAGKKLPVMDAGKCPGHKSGR